MDKNKFTPISGIGHYTEFEGIQKSQLGGAEFPGRNRVNINVMNVNLKKLAGLMCAH